MAGWHNRASNPNNPVVFMDIGIGEQHASAGRIRMELFADVAPKARHGH